MPVTKMDIIRQLQKDILPLQGVKAPAPGDVVDVGLEPIVTAFPHGAFPTGAVHEFLTTAAEDAAASSGFLAGTLAALMQRGGACVWISTHRKVFPPGLKAFGVEPDRIIFMDLQKEKEVLWATEEALKCEGLAAVIGETPDVSFTAARRFQLTVEQSRVTGFLLRHSPRNLNPIPCVARWHITHLASGVDEDLPGLGHPRWKVDISRIRNGHPGSWQVEWRAGRFQAVQQISEALPVLPGKLRQKAG